MRRNISMRISKQDKDELLIEVISKNRRAVLSRLLKDSIFAQEDHKDAQLNSIFESFAQKNQSHLDLLCNKADGTMGLLREELSGV